MLPNGAIAEPARRVLLIENVQADRYLLRNWLQAEKIEVYEAVDIITGLAACPKFQPNLILLEFACRPGRRLRSHPPAQERPEDAVDPGHLHRRLGPDGREGQGDRHGRRRLHLEAVRPGGAARAGRLGVADQGASRPPGAAGPPRRLDRAGQPVRPPRAAPLRVGGLPPAGSARCRCSSPTSITSSGSTTSSATRPATRSSGRPRGRCVARSARETSSPATAARNSWSSPPTATSTAAVHLAERFRGEIADLKICFRSQPIQVTCSVGVAPVSDASAVRLARRPRTGGPGPLPLQGRRPQRGLGLGPVPGRADSRQPARSSREPGRGTGRESAVVDA